MVSGLPGTSTARRGRGLSFLERPAGRPQGSLQATSSQRPAGLCALAPPPQQPGLTLPHPSRHPEEPRGHRGGGPGAGPPSRYSWTHRGPPRASSLPRFGSRRPEPAARPDPAALVAGPPRRAAVDASALARGQGVRGPGRAPPASRPLLPLVLALLLLPLPAGAWYKHVASPRYHTVGRAAGLLMGLRRSPYVWRRALRAAAGPPAGDALAPGAAARGAPLLRFPGPREPWEAPRRSVTAGRPVRAPRSPPALEWRPGPGSPSAADPGRPFGGTDPAPPWYPQRIALAGPRLARGQL